jgi:hypothetical protein
VLARSFPLLEAAPASGDAAPSGEGGQVATLDDAQDL